MRRFLTFTLSIVILLAWSSLFVPAGHAFRAALPAQSRQSETVIDPGLGKSNPVINPAVELVAPVQAYSNQILVKFRKNISTNLRLAVLNDGNTVDAGRIGKLDIFIRSVPAGQMQATLDRLKEDPSVEYAEPDYVAHALEIIPDDTYWADQYNLVNIHAPQAWEITTGSSAVTIAVVDTGVDQFHPDLTGKVLAGYDFVGNDTNAFDENGHGTHVAGIAAAVSNNGNGIAGVSWGARILPVRVLDAGASGSYGNVANGIIWAADNGAQIINLSLGGPYPSLTLENAVNYALAQGVILVAAAGNAGTTPIYYPARYSGVIAVGATDSLNQRANFSNYGNEIDLMAPGSWIYSLAPGNKYVYMSGTSMAAPQVAGLAAILAGIPGNSLALIENQMKSTALDLGTAGWDIYYGNGLIQMDDAIKLAQPATATPTQTASPTATLTKTLSPKPAITSSPTPTLIQTLTPTAAHTPIYTLTVTASPTSTSTPLWKSSSTPTDPPQMPDTGFVPGKARNLPVQPKEEEYQQYGNLWLEIPVLHLNIPLVGIPQGKKGWDVTWLGQRAGWLNGTAFPTWPGNSVITGHVWDASNQPGVFFQLKDLHFGDDIKIHAWGLVYTYQVQENHLITSDDFNYVYQHETFSMLSLLTCEGYNSTQEQYDFRRVVRAVLVKIDP